LEQLWKRLEHVELRDLKPVAEELVARSERRLAPRRVERQGALLSAKTFDC